MLGIVLEVVLDGYLHIPSGILGHPGSMSDVNVLNCTSIVGNVLEGEQLPK